MVEIAVIGFLTAIVIAQLFLINKLVDNLLKKENYTVNHVYESVQTDDEGGIPV